MKSPAFTLSGSAITETKTGYTGTVSQNTNGYAVHLTLGPDDPRKARALQTRMRNWYYYTVVKPK